MRLERLAPAPDRLVRRGRHTRLRAAAHATLLGALLAAPLDLAACSPATLLNATVSAGDTTFVSGIRYMPGPRGTMDLYRPAHPGGPLVVFLYGGGWTSGDKSLYAFVARPLAERGATVLVPDYRLYPEVQFPAFVEDNARAVAWAVAHVRDLGADPHAIFVIGHSAGAYDAAMLALDPHYLDDAGTSRTRLAGVVCLAGPYDFLPITDPDVIPVFASVNDGPASQPITYADGRNPPMLLLAGTDDTTVQPGNTTRLAARIRSRGGPVQDRLYPGIGHIGLVTAIAPLFSGRAPVLDDLWAWMRAQAPAR